MVCTTLNVPTTFICPLESLMHTIVLCAMHFPPWTFFRSQFSPIVFSLHGCECVWMYEYICIGSSYCSHKSCSQSLHTAFWINSITLDVVSATIKSLCLRSSTAVAKNSGGDIQHDLSTCVIYVILWSIYIDLLVLFKHRRERIYTVRLFLWTVFLSFFFCLSEWYRVLISHT